MSLVSSNISANKFQPPGLMASPDYKRSEPLDETHALCNSLLYPHSIKQPHCNTRKDAHGIQDKGMTKQVAKCADVRRENCLVQCTGFYEAQRLLHSILFVIKKKSKNSLFMRKIWKNFVSCILIFFDTSELTFKDNFFILG